MAEHPFGWLCLAPTAFTLLLAIITRRIVPSLLSGIALGALITSRGNVLLAVGTTVEDHLWRSLVDESRLRVFAFTLLMGAMVGIMHRSGAMTSLVDLVTPWARTSRRAQLTAWALGLVVFFDDYANTVLLGSTLRPVFDKLKIARSKLAFLVDATAAPVAGLALVSTWVATELAYLKTGLDQLPNGADYSVFELFVDTIPYRFYSLWMLIWVFLVALWDRDFGPMLSSQVDTLRWERRHSSSDSPAEAMAMAGAGAQRSVEKPEEESAREGTAHWLLAAVPITLTVGAVVYFLWTTGLAAVAPATDVPFWEIMGSADSYGSLCWSALLGMSTAFVLVLATRSLSWDATVSAAAHGARLLVPALAILWLAAALSNVTGNSPLDGAQAAEGPYAWSAYRLYTGEYLATWIQGDSAARLAPWFPTVFFLLSAGTSFATGTSWGTMAILLPICVPLVAQVTDPGQFAHDPVVLGSLGNVLAGAIFGDHCSPISDTTILSSQSSGCDHLQHVWTQLPYALVVGLIAVVCGTIPIGWGWPVFWTTPLATLAMVAVLGIWGRTAVLPDATTK